METQNKLLINHVAKRLPYGLKCFNETLGIQMMDCWSKYSPIKSGNFVHIQGVLSGTSKPILFPLSSLTETITIKGKSFVPIEELAKIELTNGQYRKIKLESIRVYQNNNDCVFEYFLNNHRYSFYYSKKWGCFRFSKKDSETNETKTLFVFEQKLLLEKLNEWMIDTDSLIEKGLAISVFDLTENPYA